MTNATSASGNDGGRGLINRRNFIGVVAGTASLAVLSACGGTAAPASSAPAAPGSTAPSPAASKPAASVSSAASGPASAVASPSTASSAAASGRSNSALPSYIPFKSPIKADYPAPSPDYIDGFDNYPASPFKAIDAVPGTGGSMNFMSIALFPPPTPFGQNPAWQAVNKALNVNVQWNVVSPADYQAKLATTMAGGDLPDALFLYTGPGITSALGTAPGVPQFLQLQTADLTPYLGGDAIKDYPFLANTPTQPWKNAGSIVDGKLYTIPVARPLPNFVWLKNNTVYDSVIGKDYVPKDADDFKRVLKALTNPQKGVYGTANAQGGTLGLTYYAGLFGAPNSWRLDSSGKLTKDIETDEYKAAMAYVKDLWSSGVYHPNTLTYANGAIARADFSAGKWIIWNDAWGLGWADAWRRAREMNNPPVDVGMIKPFSASSNVKPQTYASNLFLGATVLKKGSADRIKEVLRVLNYLAAPFGSQEYLLINFGVSGTDYKMDGKGNPVATTKGNSDANYVPWKYIASPPTVLYASDIPNYAKTEFDTQAELVPIAVSDPTLGLTSPTAFSKTIQLNKANSDGITDILLGRRPISDYDSVVKQWQDNGGNQMRKEYMDAIQTAK